MLPRAPLLAPLAALCSLLFACASHARKQQPAAAPAPQIPAETRVGVVRAIGPESRYVLVETPSALATSVLPEGSLLHCRPADSGIHTATADLRVSRERHQSLVVANVVAGEPVVGAVVFASPNPPPPFSTPVPGSLSSVSTAPLPGLFATPRP